MKKNELKSGAVLSYISLFLGTFIQILYTPMMLRLLGQSESGLYALANSVIGYLGVLDFGLGNAIIKYTAKYRALNDKEGEYNLNGMLIIVYSIIALIVIGAVNVFVPTVREFSFPLLVGITAGAYSSIFIASPVWVIIKGKMNKNKTVKTA